ncbi:MAG TPA: hypothetical protein PK076_02960 [Saprospiraceae bacterium]|nr:hypothetical protein [Saprospiraceae bacterium]HQW55054.1 hypothetical protein [Saprospiraceae bacterium]
MIELKDDKISDEEIVERILYSTDIRKSNPDNNKMTETNEEIMREKNSIHSKHKFYEDK